MSTESVLDVGVHTLQKLHRFLKILLEDFCRGIETKLLFHVFRTKGAIKPLQLFNFLVLVVYTVLSTQINMVFNFLNI